MSNTRHARHLPRLLASATGLALAMGAELAQTAHAASAAQGSPSASQATTLSARQNAIAPIGAAMAIGDMPGLTSALHAGLDAGLSISEIKEILVQLYAYAGFPRSLNTLNAFMAVLEERRQQGHEDAPGSEPGPLPTGEALLALGTANQTQLSGAPVRGALFEFAPAIDTYLKTHLFGDIFGRDNLDWQSRELATVGALAAMSGVEPQLAAHVRISLNVGLSREQLTQVADSLPEDAAQRLRTALQRG